MPLSSIDRLATLYLFHPLLRAGLRSRQQAIPILMYHSVSGESSFSNSYFDITVTPEVFASHLRILNESGYQMISLAEAVSQLKCGMDSSVKKAVITFDDGYENFYTEAYPLLAQYGFDCSVFLPTGYIGSETRCFKGIRCMTWSQVRELHREGVSFGSHTVSHPQLRTVSGAQLKDEVVASKQALEDHLGCSVESFCYPYAFPEHDQNFKAALKFELASAGYQHGVCTVLGTATAKDDVLFLRRLPVSSRDDSEFFFAKLAGAYEWLHGFQYAAKMVKG